MNALPLTAARMLARDWRGGELGVLVAALVLAVAVVSGISAFTTRLQSALEQESHRFLAADRALRSSRDMPEVWLQEARRRGLATAQTLSFSSMVYAGDADPVLASVKAVSEGYPLRGELSVSELPFANPRPARTGPVPGEVWLDSRLFALLSVGPGDQIEIGDARFTVRAAVRGEPDRGVSFLGLGPRVLMHHADVPATRVVQPGSRVSYRQLFAGEERALEDFTAWLRPQLVEGQRLLDVSEGQPRVGSALARAESFLLLAGSLAVVLAGVAIALAARRFSERHTDYVAIMKSLGATSVWVGRLYGGSLLLLGALATLCGCVLGALLQALAFSLFGDALPLQPGPAGPRPYLMGGLTALVCLLCFAWPPLRRLAGASPLRVLRRDMPLEMQRSLQDYALGLGAVSVLMWWYSGDLLLTLAVLAGLLLTVLLGMGLALTLLRGGRMAGMRAGSIWRLALASLQRRGSGNALQVVIFGMAIMLLLVLTLVRTSLIDSWQAQLPEGAPDHFVLNIAPQEVTGVEQLLRSQQIESAALYPMIRGRIMAVNGEALPVDGVEEGPRQREANFTWSRSIPEGNELVAGRWWEPDTREALVSLEQDFAARLEVGVGDRLGLLVGSMPLEVTVSSIRKLDWESMRPNFFMVFPQSLLAEFPATFMTSFHLGAEKKSFLNRFIREYPTISVIEMDLVVSQLRSIVDQVSAAIEVVLAIILLSGALVLIAGVQASVDSRMHESALLRALGARRNLILGGLAIEFAALGLFAGLLATLSAELSVFALQHWVMEIPYAPTPWIWPVGIIAGALLIGGLGVFGCREAVRSPPLLVLREQ
jgi:putative ABC transport system permease protein